MTGIGGRATALLFLAVAGSATPADAVNKRILQNPAVQRGRELVRRNCAGCHDVTPKGASVYGAAPPFRELGDRHTPETLRRAASDTLWSDHYGMPPIYLTAGDARAIEAFMTAFTHADRATQRRLSLPACVVRRC